jgi:hypothetical protein
MKITRHTLNQLNTMSAPSEPSAQIVCCAKKTGQGRRMAWRNAIDWLTSPAFRLHQYRNIHTQMLHGALCTVDCGHPHENKDGSDNE